MTQDHDDQGRGPGYDLVTDDEAEQFTEGSKPRTPFQKVASALRGGGADRDEAAQGRPAANPETAAGSDARTERQATPANPPWVTEQDEAAMANSPISRKAPAPGTAGAGAPARDYRDEPAASETDEDDAVAVTRPEFPVAVPAARQGGLAVPAARQGGLTVTAARQGGPTVTATGTEGQPGAATIADVPGTGAPADSGPRPGQVAGTPGDFGDLTHGNLIPDAARYADQWQHIQFRFVDDPQASVTAAADIVAQVTAEMEAAIQERQRAIAERQRSLRGRWGNGANADTEALRETLRMYKVFLDQLIGSRAG